MMERTKKEKEAYLDGYAQAQKELAIEKQRTIFDLFQYAGHLKQQYQIGSMSPFHKLVSRINAQLQRFTPKTNKTNGGVK